MTVSPQRRREIIDALRRGTVPHSSLDAFAVGLERFEPALEQELLAVKGGGAVFKAVRGHYGCGKTFFARRLCERLATADTAQGALRNIIDGWFYTLEEDALAEGGAALGEREVLVRTN